MKKRLLIALTACAALSCAAGLTACNFNFNFGGEPERKTVTVTYHLNGGEMSQGQYYDVNEDGSVEKLNYYDAGDTLNHVRVERETWIFVGWYIDSTLETEFENGQAEYPESIDLYAKWSDKVTLTQENFKEYFSVSSQWNGGMNVGNAAVNYSFKPKTGYVFDPMRSSGEIEIKATPKLGTWSGSQVQVTLNAENDYSYSGRAMVTSTAEFQLGASTLNYEIGVETLELYLLHKDPIAVTLNTDGGTVETPVLPVPGGDTLKESDLPTPVKAGYKFEGWYADAELNTKYNNKIITRETTVYAKWRKEVTFTFETFGGSEVASVTFLEGEGLKNNGVYRFGDDPVKDGYEFCGWYTDEDCEEKFTDIGAKESMTLYAKWEPYRTVTFNTHGGSEKDALTVVNSTSLSERELGADPTKGDLIFKGWYTDAEYKNKYNGEPVTGDITLHAFWCYEYEGLKTENIEEVLSVFFDYSVTYEKTQETQGVYLVDELIIHISLSLKEEFRGYDFAASINFRCGMQDADGTLLRNIVESVSIDAQNNKPSATVNSVNYKIDMIYHYDSIENMEVEYSCNWSRIYLPEGYELPE